jgi:hypothetical protein
MALPRQFSLGVGLATAALVWGIYQVALPSAADVRVGPASDRDAAAAERTATWASAAAVAGVSLLAKDPTVFVLGGSMTVAMAWWMRHSNAYDPAIGSVLGASSRQVQQSSMDDGAGYSPAV